MADCRVLGLMISKRLLEHPEGALPELRRELTGHDSILLKEAEPNPVRFNNADNALVSSGATGYTYDPDGNLTGDGTSTYTWNARNQLTGITGPATASFTYDPFGRREQATLNGSTTSYLDDGQNVLEELSGTTVAASYLLGPGPVQRYARSDSTGTSSYLTDALGSVIGLANGSGTLQTTYTYDPFGNATTSGTASPSPYQYAGMATDGTGLDYDLARYYQPATGQFISQDPAGLAGSGTNLYGYAADNPINYTDPTGLASVKDWSWSDLLSHWRGALQLAGAAICIFASAGACIVGGLVFAAANYIASAVDTHSVTQGAPQFFRDVVTTLVFGGYGKVLSGTIGAALAARSSEEADTIFSMQGLWDRPYTGFGNHASGIDLITTGAKLIGNTGVAVGCYTGGAC